MEKHLLEKQVEALKAENERLRDVLKDCYRAGCNGDEHDVGIMLVEILEELGYEFDDEGRLVD